MNAPFSYTHLRDDLLSGKKTCEQIAKFFLDNIDQSSTYNIYLSIFRDKVIAKARELDLKMAKGERIGKAFGLPIAVKDVLAIKDENLTCGSKMLESYVSPYDATVIKKLMLEDAMFLGKVNMDEFAMGSSNENSAFGVVKNPINPEYVPGGSSGGSAAAVASDTCLVALGSDTGGSVRQPASFCNVIGFKPSYGRISRYGLVAFASSFDQVGILSKSSKDVALVAEIISGNDEHDSTSSTQPVPNYLEEMTHFDIKNLKIGIPKEFFAEELNSEIKELVMSKVDLLESKGAKVFQVSLPSTSYVLSCYYILTMAEASANLARYDGVRYGHRSQKLKGLDSMYTFSRSEGFGKEVKRRIMLGTYVLSSGFYDAYYKKAQKVRRIIQEDYLRVLNKVDVIAGPASPFFPFKFGDKMKDPMEMYLADIYTVGVNLAGIPAICVPAGFGKKGLPVGIQFIAKHFDESTLLAISSNLE